VLFAFAFQGCSPVSEEELQSLRNETEALEAELERLKSEGDILNRALDNVYREKDRVLDRIDQLSNPARQQEGEEALTALQTDGGAGSEDSAAQPSGNQRKYKVQRGDTLSQIASQHNTTIEALVRLNPFLANRSQFMVWENDTLTLPGAAATGGGSAQAAPSPANPGNAGGFN
jgi:LysM repeat protein